jgi:hypothetical protein
MPRFIPFLIILGLVGAAGLAIYFRLPQPQPIKAPDLTLFSEGLQRATESEIGPLSLIQNVIELPVQQSDIDPEVERIKKLAEIFGGNATVNSLTSGSDRDLLMEIPQTLVQQFIEAVRNQTRVVSLGSPTPGEKTQVIEVKLHVAK